MSGWDVVTQSLKQSTASCTFLLCAVHIDCVYAADEVIFDVEYQKGKRKIRDLLDLFCGSVQAAEKTSSFYLKRTRFLNLNFTLAGKKNTENEE